MISTRVGELARTLLRRCSRWSERLVVVDAVAECHAVPSIAMRLTCGAVENLILALAIGAITPGSSSWSGPTSGCGATSQRRIPKRRGPAQRCDTLETRVRQLWRRPYERDDRIPCWRATQRDRIASPRVNRLSRTDVGGCSFEATSPSDGRRARTDHSPGSAPDPTNRRFVWSLDACR